MNNIVGCRIKSVKTNIFCEIAIGWNGGGLPFVWSRIENKLARLTIPQNGQWGLVDLPHYEGATIAILPQSPTSRNPDGSETFVTIAHLYGLPKDFMENAQCGNYATGSGIWRRTMETLTYEMFLPCAR